MRKKIMFKNFDENFFFLKFPAFLIILLPFTLVSGSFLPDLSISIISILFIILIFKKDMKKYTNHIFFKIFLIFYLIINVSALLGSDQIASLKNSFFYFRHGFFAFYFWYLLDNLENLKENLLHSFVIIFSILVIDGFIQYFFGSNIFGWPIAGSGRISSLFGDELILGSYLSRLFPIIFCLLILIHKENFKKIYLIYIFILFIACDVLIFLSGERTALTLTLMSTLYIILFARKFRYFRIIAFFSAIVLIIFITLINPTAKKRVIDQTLNQTGILQDSETSDYKRSLKKFKQFEFVDFYIFSLPHEILFSTGLNVFKNNKILGVGPKNFRSECRDKENYIMGYSCDTHPHNTYIQLLSETGFIGFLVIFSLFIWLIKESINILIAQFKKDKNIKDELICLNACFLMTLWPIIPTGSFFHNWMCIVYFFPIGLYLHLKQEQHKN